MRRRLFSLSALLLVGTMIAAEEPIPDNLRLEIRWDTALPEAEQMFDGRTD